MFKKVMLGLLSLALMTSTVFIAGCESSAGTGTLIGVGGGALAGQAIGGDTKSTLIGAGVGAAGGYIIGNEMDKSKAQQQQQAAAQQQQAPAQAQSYNMSASDSNRVTVWLNNGNGSQTAIDLIRNPDGSYTGPRGERYQTMPTGEQLKPVYGLK
jgi:hypothetical protein